MEGRESAVCADCRNDKPRISIALELENNALFEGAKPENTAEPYIRLCPECGQRKRFWWFYGFPITGAELDAI